jgi:hypothetical protein
MKSFKHACLSVWSSKGTISHSATAVIVLAEGGPKLTKSLPALKFQDS